MANRRVVAPVKVRLKTLSFGNQPYFSWGEFGFIRKEEVRKLKSKFVSIVVIYQDRFGKTEHPRAVPIFRSTELRFT